MTNVVLGIAEQAIAQDLRDQLEGFEGLSVVAIAESTHEVIAEVFRQDADVVIVHDRLGPEPMAQVLRDLSVRRPATGTIVLTSDATPRVYEQALEGAARGVLTYPVLLEELQSTLDSATGWSDRMRSLIESDEEGARQSMDWGKVVAVVGAKGGVGATLIASHLAWDIARSVSALRVALLDLDLGSGDVPGYLGVSYRVSVADLAKVHEDITDRAVSDSVTVHDSGLHLLLAPPDIRDTDFVTPASVRQVLDAMRRGYDLVIVDVGSKVTPIQASVVEMADEVMMIVTPDVPTVRALRRTLTAWETLGARKADDVRIVVNKQHKQDEIQPETLAELAGIPIVNTVIPAMYRQVESAINSRDPSLVKSQAWWNGLRSIANTLDLVGRKEVRSHPTSDATRAVAAHAGGRRSRRSRRSEAGQIAIENVAMLPILFFFLIVIAQVISLGSSVIWAQHGAAAAARTASVGGSAAAYTQAARDAVPVAGSTVRAFYNRDAETMTVSVPIPLIAPGIFNLGGPDINRTVPVRVEG